MDLTAALDALDHMTDAATDPGLDAGELVRILNAAALPDIAGNTPSNDSTAPAWTASTATTPDTVIVAGDRYWRCITGGTTAATEPSWPDLTGVPVDDRRHMTDGTVVWSDAGTTWTPTWDLNRAAMLGWEAKAGKAAGGYDFRTEDQQFARSQIAAHCLAMADRYRARVTPGIA